MANVRNANTYYIDTNATTLTEKNIRVTHVTVTASGGAGRLVLSDISTAAPKVDLRVETDGHTEVFDFSDNPIVFPNGINPGTVTNCVATCHLQGSAS